MKRKSGAGGEGGLASGSAGAVRASTTEQYKTLDKIRANKEKLADAETMAEIKQNNEMMLDDLTDAFRQYYDYDQSGFHYIGEFREMVIESERVGLPAAMKEYGFSSAPEELVQELIEYKDILRNSFTEYFESKPERVVDVGEFVGAIVPDTTPESTVKKLEGKGLKVVRYTDEEDRTAKRIKFKDYAFSLMGAGTVGSAVMSEGEQYRLKVRARVLTLLHQSLSQ
jgi:hypothetical protein